jgi:hypothetical protein
MLGVDPFPFTKTGGWLANTPAAPDTCAKRGGCPLCLPTCLPTLCLRTCHRPPPSLSLHRAIGRAFDRCCHLQG